MEKKKFFFLDKGKYNEDLLVSAVENAPGFHHAIYIDDMSRGGPGIVASDRLTPVGPDMREKLEIKLLPEENALQKKRYLRRCSAVLDEQEEVELNIGKLAEIFTPMDELDDSEIDDTLRSLRDS